ncbi:MAG: long-chain fatty acid--CoA ligase [Deltaproteobacteria bacterium]|nr:long-chain fatty acid--CoA ligase [Deltaproteobacteria bacterium]
MSERNLVQIFLKTAELLKSKPCFRYKEGEVWKALSWIEAAERVMKIGCGLQSIGVKKGDAVALYSSTRVEWTLSDLGILSIGAITVPIYQSNTVEQAAYIIKDSEAGVVIVENLDLLKKVRSENKTVSVLLISGQSSGKSVVTWSEIMIQRGDQASWRKGVEQIKSTDVATYVYTSGTTGNPKGVILTHKNFMAEVGSLEKVLKIEQNYESLLFLPLAHIVARALQFFHLKVGFVQAYAESIEKLVDNLAEIRPHFFVAVPRIFEKVYERIHAQVKSGSKLKQWIFHWATSVGRDVSQRRQQRKRLPLLLQFQHKLASLLVFKKLKARLGGRVLFTISGGAPLSQEIGEFFDAAGILILEGYGLTETTAAINCNRPDGFKFGFVGPVVEGVEEKIAPDGEILVRGPVIFQGYYKKPEATREVLTPDGWFHTGDIGEFDMDGFLKITDRKKDIIVTAGGKNVAPQNIENILKMVPYISQVVVHGDKRKYLSALVTLNRDQVEKYAHSTGISFGDFSELTRHPKIYALIQKSIEEKNRKLASFETIKKFAILEGDFSQESGELTPTLKVKRRFVSEKYKDVLSQLYRE